MATIAAIKNIYSALSLHLICRADEFHSMFEKAAEEQKKFHPYLQEPNGTLDYGYYQGTEVEKDIIVAVSRSEAEEIRDKAQEARKLYVWSYDLKDVSVDNKMSVDYFNRKVFSGEIEDLTAALTQTVDQYESGIYAGYVLAKNKGSAIAKIRKEKRIREFQFSFFNGTNFRSLTCADIVSLMKGGMKFPSSIEKDPSRTEKGVHAYDDPTQAWIVAVDEKEAKDMWAEHCRKYFPANEKKIEDKFYLVEIPKTSNVEFLRGGESDLHKYCELTLHKMLQELEQFINSPFYADEVNEKRRENMQTVMECAMCMTKLVGPIRFMGYNNIFFERDVEGMLLTYFEGDVMDRTRIESWEFDLKRLHETADKMISPGAH